MVQSLEGQLNLSMVSEYYFFTAVIVRVTFYRLASNNFVSVCSRLVVSV